MTVRYRSAPDGSWLVVHTGALVLLLESDGLDVAGMWDALTPVPPLAEVLGFIAERGMDALPAFGLVHHDGDEIVVVVRGDVVAEVSHGESTRLDAAGLATWMERRFPQSAAVRLARRGGDADGSPVTGRLPLGAGVVPGDAVDVGEADAPESAVEPSGYDDLLDVTIVRRLEYAVHGGDTLKPEVVKLLRAEARARRTAGVKERRYRLTFSKGSDPAPLDRRVIVGRVPVATRALGEAGEEPRLVRIASTDLSRTHAQFDLVRDTVQVTDLHSANGTYVVLPDGERYRLTAGENSAVPLGVTIELGDIGVVVEEST
jgi:hypothetical protein